MYYILGLQQSLNKNYDIKHWINKIQQLFIYLTNAVGD